MFRDIQLFSRAQSILLAGLLIVCFTGTGVSATWIVDAQGGPGVDFTDIPPAIFTALDGDTILVRTGDYSTFTLDKALTLAADTGAGPIVPTGTPVIENIGANETALLVGFTMTYLKIRNCPGTVIVDDCLVGHATGDAALRVESCNHLILTRTQMLGENDYWNGRAADISNSTVILSQCTLWGANGADGEYLCNGGDGCTGLTAQNSTIYCQSTPIHGGNGGDAYYDEYKIFNGGDGACAIVLTDCHLELFGLPELMITGGYGGEPSNWYGYYGDDANAILADNSTILHSGYTIDTSSLNTTPPPIFGGGGNTIEEITPAVPIITTLGSGQLGTFIQPTLQGPPDWNYLIFVSPLSDVNTVGSMLATFLLDPGFLLPLVAGTLPANGEVSFYIPIPYTPAWQGAGLWLQAYLQPVVGNPYISTSAGFVLR